VGPAPTIRTSVNSVFMSAPHLSTIVDFYLRRPLDFVNDR
jgi:hypothetical protein